MALKIQTIPAGPIGANSYIVTDEVSGLTAVIDCGEFSREIAEAVKNKSVKYIMLTHGHFDHILGVYDLKEATGAQVLIHTDDAESLFNGFTSLASLHFGEGLQKSVRADRLLNDGDEITLGETVFKVLNTKGHTDGSVLFVDEADGIMFTGDTLFKGSCGRTDLPGGNTAKLLKSLRRINEIEGDYAVYTGHGEATTLETERAHNIYLRRL